MLIEFPDLIRKYNVSPKGILHCGSNSGQERFWYADAGISKVVWIEAIPSVFELLKKNTEPYPEHIALNACISNKDFQPVSFNISSNDGESSSMFEFGTHAQSHPTVTFVDKINLTTIRIDTLLGAKNINVRDYDFLNLDLQSAELLALESMGDMIRLFKWIYVEVNRGNVYKNCPQFEEICDYVADFGFELKEVKWTGANWGDAFFEKTKDMSCVFNRKNGFPLNVEEMVSVPKQFTTTMPFNYPDDNFLVFEKWYAENFKEKTERQYLGIQWTAFHVSHNFGNDLNAIQSLQNYIDSLDRTKKYYTICQFDLGCMVDFKDLDIKVYAMAGGRADYRIPLICQKHKFEFNQHKTLLANFVGRPTHPIREKVIKSLSSKQGCYISEAKHDLSAYCSLMASSVFGICPRGFSATSFRIMEALQYGAIPVYISDEFFIPHNVPFNYYGVLVKESEIDNLDEILRSIPESEIKEKQSRLKEVFDSLYTFEGTRKLILEDLKDDNKI